MLVGCMVITYISVSNSYRGEPRVSEVYRYTSMLNSNMDKTRNVSGCELVV